MRSIGNQFTNVFSTKKEPGFNEICALLNLDEDPIALVDLENGSLLFINSRLIRLTERSNQEVKDQGYPIIFNELDIATISSGEIRETTIQLKNKSTVNVKVRFDFIDPKAHWVAIHILPEMKKEFREERPTTNITPGLLKLIRLSENEDLSAVLEQAMEICSQVLQVESVCLYLLDPASPQLKKTAWHESQVEFPDVLPSTDLARFEQPGLWVTGNRVLSELQRFARLNKADYLATAPLSQEGAILGLLAAGGEGVKPDGARLDVLELLAAILVTELQQHILADNLNTEISQLIGAKLSRNTVFEYMNEGIITLDEKLTVLELNPAAEWMLGYANWEVKGQSYENLLIGSERFLPALQEALLGKQTHDIGKASLNRRNGQAFPVKAKVMPISVADKVQLIEVFLSDISEHEQSKALTQQLEHRAVLGDYTAAFAHDVRNPINNISTGLQLLQAKLSEEDPNQEVINRMQGDCTRLNHLMESFLAFSRPLELKFELIEIEPFLRRILDRWQPRMARENVTSTLHIEEGIPRLQGDPRSLENVFTNLISNALEAMTEVGDTLVVKAEKIRQSTNREMVAISISDNGPGIPADILEHIFEPFVTTRQKGTGLGLAITNQIVTAHKGSIRVNSFPGGTVFSVEIPAENGD